MCRICWVLVFALGAVSAGLAWKFVFQGQVAEGSDGRTSILLEPAERDLVLAEMRTFLESVQQVADGVARKDMEQVVKAARRSGISAQGTVPGSLIGKLPLGFKKLGFDTHSKFDQLALDAESMEDPDMALSQLATLMQNCVSCHAAFRFDTAPGAP